MCTYIRLTEKDVLPPPHYDHISPERIAQCTRCSEDVYISMYCTRHNTYETKCNDHIPLVQADYTQ